MFVIRSIQASDLDALIDMATQVGSGMTTLKPDRKMLGDRVECAVASFHEAISPEKRDYMFVMEDTANGKLAGVCAIKSAVGLTEPFYNYRIGTLVHSSRELNVFTRMETLYLSNDLTGASELCSLFLQPDYRTGYNGKWLSKSRFLFIAQFQQLFTEKIIAEMRGYLTDDGTSPFYEGLGRHFFKMDFDHVDGLTAIGKKSFIAELMPRQPLYVDYLPQSAREVIGQVHRSTLPARKLLEQEGMHYEGYVDIFDAGPVLQGRVAELRGVRDSVLRVALEARPEGETECLLVSNTKLDDFRMVLAQTTTDGADIALSAQELALLHVQAGDPVRTLSLNVRKNNG
ncbi:arginine N-succinyltransferase [Massilia sp. Dwa41.01b]|uniref:arginine N-succinyltransferase n=1 Tax=unclassified Massilia TaxID=2609279 RepID=UPI001603516F|nr:MULTISPECIES: arginine N-succinyltransferase [unclassified Massilia]QNA87539.1 arginine N-succinyltransferase [Massilia sp. Dwa41.01b]QNA98447.1 arginine N-succinyltransferase [Massilia sp. Se16.2.3]